jgi:hypothetical protein
LRSEASDLIVRRRNLIEALDRADGLSSLATMQHAEHLEQPISRDVSVARRLLSRDDLLLRLLAVLPSWARVVLSSRRDPAIRLHQLRLVNEVAEIRSGDLRFTESETRELLAGSEISLSEGGVAALYERTEGWAAGLRLAVISLTDHADPERFVAEFSGTGRSGNT